MPTVLTELKAHTDANGNRVEVGAGVRFEKSRISFSDSGGSLVVGDGVFLYECDIRLGRGSVVLIGSQGTIAGRISVGLNSSVHIGRSVTVTKNLQLRAVESTSISIGDDCIIASGVSIRTNDGHIIRDAKSRERINPSASVVVQDHVWLCDEVMVLKGVTIGQASIVAARSVVTKDVSPNCIYAGMPAKLVKAGVTWERDVNTITEQFYL